MPHERRSRWEQGTVCSIGEKPEIMTNSKEVVPFSYRLIRWHGNTRAGVQVGDEVSFTRRRKSNRVSLVELRDVQTISKRGCSREVTDALRALLCDLRAPSEGGSSAGATSSDTAAYNGPSGLVRVESNMQPLNLILPRCSPSQSPLMAPTHKTFSETEGGHYNTSEHGEPCKSPKCNTLATPGEGADNWSFSLSPAQSPGVEKTVGTNGWWQYDPYAMHASCTRTSSTSYKADTEDELLN
eukprot:Hpha_TRINITY_DN16342_c2_g1::TRINITY_DN16342_c2_g1_i1::g.58393::m.58393